MLEFVKRPISHCDIAFTSFLGVKSARNESGGFPLSTFQSMGIWASVQFWDGCACAQFNQSSISVEAGNESYTINYEWLINVMHQTVIYHVSKSPARSSLPGHVIPVSLEFIDGLCL
jgi:hypothetical protein